MRLATYNIRNVRALDPASWWWRRRRALRTVMASLDADVVGVQEAYPSQIRYLRQEPFGAPGWQAIGRGRNRNHGGEAVPVFSRTAALALVDQRTHWFGPAPDVAGSRADGAAHPRIVTIGHYEVVENDERLTVANLHLDPASLERRTDSVEQLLAWLADDLDGPLVVLGDFNGPLAEPWAAVLADAGLRSALPDGTGPTANAFGDDDAAQQIDHVFVSASLRVDAAAIVDAAGHASDHYPVTVDVAFVS